MKKIILIVLDSLGVGGAKDTATFNDEGANTLLHILEKNPSLAIPNLKELGLCNIDTIKELGLESKNPKGYYGRLEESSTGKDTITGHWEMMGIRTTIPFKTYPNGFPDDFIEEFEKTIKRKVLGNYPASGTEIIEKLGSEHEKTGMPIIYTSADSVLQIAANIEVVPLEELYDICEIARKMLVGKWACGRVIARPYEIIDGKRKRTSDRKDYAVSPPEKTLLDKLKEENIKVVAVGKIEDIFNGQGIGEAVHTKNNMDGVDKTLKYIKEEFAGLIFTNLVDFDSNFGHRRDPIGYGKALEEFDCRLPEIFEAMGKEDLLILTADHGNDPIHSGTDHTRETVPGIYATKEMWDGKIEGKELDVRHSFADIGATIARIFQIENLSHGEPIEEIINNL